MITIEQIIPAVVAVASLALMFFKRIPSAAIAYAGMVLSVVLGWGLFLSGSLWFWGIAAALVTINYYISQHAPITALRIYTCAGTLVGACVGAVSGSTGALTLGTVLGAAAGFFAFTRTPRGHMNASALQTLEIFGDMACPPVFTCLIAIQTLAQLPLFYKL